MSNIVQHVSVLNFSEKNVTEHHMREKSGNSNLEYVIAALWPIFKMPYNLVN